MIKRIEFDNLIERLLPKEHWPAAREIAQKTQKIDWTLSYTFSITVFSALLIHFGFCIWYYYLPEIAKPLISKIQNWSIEIVGTKEYLSYLYTICVLLVPYFITLRISYHKLKSRKEDLRILLADEKTPIGKAYSVIAKDPLLQEACGLSEIEKKYQP